MNRPTTLLRLEAHVRARKAEDQVRKLRAGLMHFGHHRDGCAYMFNMPCSCGLVAPVNGARR